MPVLLIAEERRRPDVQCERNAAVLYAALVVIACRDAGVRIPAHIMATAEDAAARAGFGAVTAQTVAIAERVEAGENVPLSELEAALLDVWSGPLSLYFTPPTWDELEVV